MRILILGEDSSIGRGLLRAYQRIDVPVIGTSRRADKRESLSLDLKDESWSLPDDISAAILCAGVTRLAACKADPQGSYAVNVRGIGAAARQLHASGAFVLHFSTDKVFDGETAFAPADAPYAPITEYGRQKAEAEQQILKLGTRAAVLRLSKVLGSRPALFQDWTQQLQNRDAIHPFSDMTLAPIPLNSVITVAHWIVTHRAGGIWQLSGQQDVTYARVAQHLAAQLEVDPSLVQPIPAANTLEVPVSRYTSLDITRLREEIGIEPPDIWWTLKNAFALPNY